MNILEEYIRLQQLYLTEVGRRLIDEQWMIASNYVKFGENDWRKKSASSGNQVAGFAFDIKTNEIEITPKGYFNHSAAKEHLLRKVVDEIISKPNVQMSQIETDNFLHQMDTYESRVIDGRLAYIPEWSFPLATVFSGLLDLEPKILDQLEKVLLEQKIGLPLFQLQLLNHRTTV